jgi:hypothetical protein
MGTDNRAFSKWMWIGAASMMFGIGGRVLCFDGSTGYQRFGASNRRRATVARKIPPLLTAASYVLDCDREIWDRDSALSPR